MKITRLSVLTICLLFVQEVVYGVSQDLKSTDAPNSIAVVETKFTCEEANRIKFNEPEFRKLSRVDRVLLDAKFASCEPPAQGESAADQDIAVVIVNPVPTSDDDRVAYGLIKRNDLRKARELCSTTGEVAGVTLMIAGTAAGNPAAVRIGSALFTYSDVSCESLEKNFANGNIMAAIGPSAIIGHAALNKLTKDLVDNIPLLSGADKKNVREFLDNATSPPSVIVGKRNVDMSAGGVKISVRKPKIRIKKPRWL